MIKSPKTNPNDVKDKVKKYYQATNIQLTEDSFGTVTDEKGKTLFVKRFTWKNHNKIEAQVITYGARITSLKLPNRKGHVEDVIMGFDDIAGYLYYNQHSFGAVIGRVSNKIEKGTFSIEGKQFWLSKNTGPHHANGGFRGYDKVMWIPHVDGSRVILSYVSLDKEEGYPGDLLVRITYELTTKNEFHVDMEAISTKPTIVNLSNRIFFNMSGHDKGPEELYKHTLTVNANCFTPMQDNGLPVGEILNVIHTDYDFQIPKLLNKVIGIAPDDGIDQNFCVTRGTDQSNCFVSRLLHSPSGRLVEIYSNQPGVQVCTGNHFGYGIVDIPNEEKPPSQQSLSSGAFDLIGKLHTYLVNKLALEDKKDYTEMRSLIRKLEKKRLSKLTDGTLSPPNTPVNLQLMPPPIDIDPEDIVELKLTPLQVQYLESMRNIAKSVESVTEYNEIQKVIDKILGRAIALDPVEVEKRPSAVDEKPEELYEQPNYEDEIKKEDVDLQRKGMLRLGNKIPSFYQDGRIHGKNGAIYKRHGAVCFQTQNYPNAIYHKNFPNCILKPGETYRHSIVYKFWIQEGNPNKWIKRNFPESKQ